ncbi:MAG: stimulus-sensing domain-containing protein [Alphaproteobacteria bacterium]
MARRGEGTPRARKRALGSPITRRILAVNVFALATLFGGVFYLNDYESRLVDAELQALRRQGDIIAIALAEGMTSVPIATDDDEGGSSVEYVRFDPPIVRTILRRVVAETRTRARLFAPTGELLVDSQTLGPGSVVRLEELPPPRTEYPLVERLLRAFDWVVNWVPRRENLEPYREAADQVADDYPEVMHALGGVSAGGVRGDLRGGMVLTAAVPVQHYRKIAGALLLSTDGRSVERGLRSVREDILKVFAVSLTITILLSFYLARTIARPIRRLAAAAERIRSGTTGRQPRPEFSVARRDEIGELAMTLRDMTDALWQRMDAIERFAADVSHEIKNPLSSLRSAVETAARVKDPEQQRKLMTIVLEDVARLDRLITDISSASRLDAELSREETGPVDIDRLLSTTAEVHAQTHPDGPRMVYDRASPRPIVKGLEDRLGQVVRNLVANAVSFTPPTRTIRLAAAVRGKDVEITVEDDGPGIPAGKFEAIFKRFYSERPSGEKFGTHSGLGLSISKQIVEAHGGAIRAENRTGPDGGVLGARFVVRLPLAPDAAPR